MQLFEATGAPAKRCLYLDRPCSETVGQAVWFGGQTALLETAIDSLIGSGNTVLNGSCRQSSDGYLRSGLSSGSAFEESWSFWLVNIEQIGQDAFCIVGNFFEVQAGSSPCLPVNANSGQNRK